MSLSVRKAGVCEGMRLIEPGFEYCFYLRGIHSSARMMVMIIST